MKVIIGVGATGDQDETDTDVFVLTCRSQYRAACDPRGINGSDS